MKTIALFIAGIFLLIYPAACQSQEFNTYPNGLIYSEKTMAKLSHIVDSLNLKYKVCNLQTSFLAKSQTIGNVVEMNSGNIKQALNDINSGISLEEFQRKHPTAKIQNEVLVTRYKRTTYEDKDIIEFEHFDLKGDGISIESEDLSLYNKVMKNKWVTSYREKTTYSSENLNAMYFPNEFESAPIPEPYKRMIGYTDCLIDTTTTKFKEHVKEGWVALPDDWQNLPESKKKKLLDNMRGTRVIGGCSMDRRPREHAIHIALLSAETANWEVFLKSHLDIMNDRFERMSDGSYAWKNRNTYIKELEELNINVTDLLLGISLRIENPAKNHYYGSIGRLGRALSETKNAEELEQSILNAIKDPKLDNFNRLIFYFLFRNYLQNLPEESRQKVAEEKLALAVKSLPENFIRQLQAK